MHMTKIECLNKIPQINLFTNWRRRFQRVQQHVDGPGRRTRRGVEKYSAGVLQNTSLNAISVCFGVNLGSG